MKYIIQVKDNSNIIKEQRVRYLQNVPLFYGKVERYWLFEEYKRNATQFDWNEANKMIASLLVDWSWDTYTIYEVGDIEDEGKRYTPIKEISISYYR